MRRLPLLLLSFIALFAVAFAAACGGDDDDTTGGVSSPAATATSAPSATPAPTKIGGSMILATTTSTQDSGLLDALVPDFQKKTGIEVKVIAVGTGAALEMGAKGEADAVLVHAPASEKKYVDNADLVGGKLIMHNDFIIIGPANDPAKVKGSTSLAAAMTAMASGPFISRGDKSGTHTKELDLWKAANVDVATVKQREETGQGMGATIAIADQKNAYTLTDRATYLAQKKNIKLVVLFEGEKSLLNIYHAYVVNPEKFKSVKKAQAETFVAYLVAPETQKLIAEFGKEKYGEPLFFADAGKREEDVGK